MLVICFTAGFDSIVSAEHSRYQVELYRSSPRKSCQLHLIHSVGNGRVNSAISPVAFLTNEFMAAIGMPLASLIGELIDTLELVADIEQYRDFVASFLVLLS